VEDDLRLAHGGHGPVLNQLPALWGSEDVVRGPAGVRPQAGEGGQPVLSGQLQELQRLSAPQDDAHLAADPQAARRARQ